MFHAGQQIGLYTLINPIGRGGFGEVWLAERRAKFVTTKVAVKLPLDEQVDHEAIKQEATLWEQASGHPNILPILDADEYDGQIVIVSEYAPDGSLEQWLKQNRKMPIEKAIVTMIKILDGLEYLHSRNIIHRDLKPANILLQGNTPRLADFGISRAMRTTMTSQSQNISGTFAYMSPEALDGKRSMQTDIWSVGVNLYQFLTGTLPFPQKEPSLLFPAIIMREYEPLSDDVPQNLKNVVAKALAKLPENRYTSANEMRDDLQRVLHGEEIILTDLPKTQPSLPASELLLTQKVLSILAQNFQGETKTFVNPVLAYSVNENRNELKVFLYSLILLILVSAIVLIAYYATVNSRKNTSNTNKITKLGVTQSSNKSTNSENVNASMTPTPTPTPDKVQLQTVINRYLQGVARVGDDFGAFREFKENRKIYYADLDNDNDNDAVVISVMGYKSGGNYYIEIMSVYRNDNGTFSAVTDSPIGAKLYRDTELKSIKDGRIYFDTMTFDKDKDAACCPSIKGKTSYVLNGNKLIEK